ncbi:MULTISPECIES: BRCT domain-containing protein [unclassified Psychrobacillus]|uniref:BRCT domain-containing protein n=1 Tax=unclassified Psychrobacillus TaxID=2636677 RepID=UPI0030F6E8B4
MSRNDSSLIAGKVFVITGKLSRQRMYFEEEIQSLGGIVNNKVNRNTDYLIMGPAVFGTVKHKSALEMGITILSEGDYQQMMGQYW